jgi:hypothetical protein
MHSEIRRGVASLLDCAIEPARREQNDFRAFRVRVRGQATISNCYFRRSLKRLALPPKAPFADPLLWNSGLLWVSFAMQALLTTSTIKRDVGLTGACSAD